METGLVEPVMEAASADTRVATNQLQWRPAWLSR